jgi:hypothetical protein
MSQKSFSVALGCSTCAAKTTLQTLLPQVLVGQYILRCSTAYNRLAALLPLLPVAALPNSACSQQHSQRVAQLPSMLQCAWKGPLPFLKPVNDAGSTMGLDVAATGSTGGWVAVQAAKLWDELGIMQGLEPVHMAPHLLKPADMATTTTVAVAASATVAAAAAVGVTAAVSLQATNVSAAVAASKDARQAPAGGAAGTQARYGRKVAGPGPQQQPLPPTGQVQATPAGAGAPAK